MDNKEHNIDIDINIFKTNYESYIEKGLSVIPDKYMSKMPAIKAWSDYCYKLPNKDELLSWSNNLEQKGSGISLALGEASKVVALDIDSTDQKILDIIMPLLPSSPVVKKGAKGETRLFKYTGEVTDILKYNGEVVIEILSNGKKTTLPPSIHPSGESYIWTGEKELLESNVEDLPILPPALFSHLQSKLKLELPETVSEGFNKIRNGRNDELSSYCGKLIAEGTPLDESIQKLIEFDKDNHEIPLFSDPNEMRHTEEYSNALNFYTNHLCSINTKRYRTSKEYEIPVLNAVTELGKIKEIREGKSPRQERQKSQKEGLFPAQGALASIYLTILDNSWIKQPDMAFGASLALMSTLVSRKVVFQGMSPNLYILNVSQSGSGKNAPQEILKDILIDINAEDLLGAGDYVSDASLMDSLTTSPVRLDIMDEAGGILRSVNSGKSEYNGKMADVLAELYTTSNNKYLGRATADGRKGSCYRPNVNILASTTPTGFSEGVSLKAVEKGLMGRFLIFKGDPHKKAERLTSFPKIDVKTIQTLKFWHTLKPEDFNKEGGKLISGIRQNYIELEANEEANNLLDQIFKEFDDMRINATKSDCMLPIISRLYQQMVKLVIIHACSRVQGKLPIINKSDVMFGYNNIKYIFTVGKEMISRHIFRNNQEREIVKILSLIDEEGGSITKTELNKKTRNLNKRQRDNIIEELIDSEELLKDVKSIEGKNKVVYYLGNMYERI